MPRKLPNGAIRPAARADHSRRPSYPDLSALSKTDPPADWPSEAKVFACAVPASLWPAWTDLSFAVALNAINELPDFERREGGAR